MGSWKVPEEKKKTSEQDAYGGELKRLETATLVPRVCQWGGGMDDGGHRTVSINERASGEGKIWQPFGTAGCTQGRESEDDGRGMGKNGICRNRVEGNVFHSGAKGGGKGTTREGIQGRARMGRRWEDVVVKPRVKVWGEKGSRVVLARNRRGGPNVEEQGKSGAYREAALRNFPK